MVRRKKDTPPKSNKADALELSRETYVDRRDDRIAYYYFVRRVTKPPAIYDFLIRECRECLGPDVGSAHASPDEMLHDFVPLISENRQSGLRMVETVVMRLRAEALPEEVLALRRPIETEKVRRTWEHLLQIQMDIFGDKSMVNVQKVSPSGQIVTIVEPRYSNADRGKAGKAAKELVEKIGKLTGAVLVAPEADGDPDHPGGQDAPEPFKFNFPNIKGTAADLSDMVAMNLERGKTN